MCRPATRLFCALLLGLMLGCGGEEEDPVRKTLDEMFSAAEERDAPTFVEHLAPDFSGAEGVDRAQVERLIRAYFGAYESLTVEVSDLRIERSEGAARATFVAKLTGQRGKGGFNLEALLPPESDYRFDLRLVPAGDRWKVAWASWALEQER